MLGHFLAFVIVSHCPKSLAASFQQLFEHPVGFCKGGDTYFVFDRTSFFSYMVIIDFGVWELFFIHFG